MKLLVRLLIFTLCALQLLAALPAAAKEGPAPMSATVEALIKSLTESQHAALLKLLNEGDATSLEAIPGVGPARAAAIIQARPYAALPDVMHVAGVGEGTFAKMVAHAQAGFPPPAAAKKRAPAKKREASGAVP